MSELYDKLTKQFPPEAYDIDGSRGFDLTTIKAYYIVERLNETFDLCGKGWWFSVTDWIKTDKEVICIGNFIYKEDEKEYKVPNATGSHKVVNNNWGDAYKSAMTNAISKATSFLGIGLDVYKGEYNGSGGAKKKPKKAPSEPAEPQTSEEGTAEPTEDLFNTCVMCGNKFPVKNNERKWKDKCIDCFKKSK